MQEFNKVCLNYKCDTPVLLFSRCLVWGQFDWIPWGLIMWTLAIVESRRIRHLVSEDALIAI